MLVDGVISFAGADTAVVMADRALAAADAALNPGVSLRQRARYIPHQPKHSIHSMQIQNQ
ncbi:hypothetical protein [Jeotgalibacillus malaysiensis]|uniref:hypothetical protein n=1 Tax=Jeotgalibacillus malaysiensis TaxID=1508404 RepID=UPI00384F4099